jgi:hypothetical protein
MDKYQQEVRTAKFDTEHVINFRNLWVVTCLLSSRLSAKSHSNRMDKCL